MKPSRQWGGRQAGCRTILVLDWKQRQSEITRLSPLFRFSQVLDLRIQFRAKKSGSPTVCVGLVLWWIINKQTCRVPCYEGGIDAGVARPVLGS